MSQGHQWGSGSIKGQNLVNRKHIYSKSLLVFNILTCYNDYTITSIQTQKPTPYSTENLLPWQPRYFLSSAGIRMKLRDLLTYASQNHKKATKTNFLVGT